MDKYRGIIVWSLAILLVVTFGSVVGAKMFETIEDKVVITHSTGGNDAAWAEAVIPHFKEHIKEKYGKTVNVIMSTGMVPAQWAKMITEWPNPSSDVYMAYPNQVFEGIEKGYWLRIADYFTEEELAGFEEGLIDRYLGYGIPYDRHYWGPAVRKDLIPFDFSSWSDFLNPQLKNRMTFDSALKVGSGYLAVLAAALSIGEDWRDWANADGTLNREAATPTLRALRKWYENALTLTEGSGTIRPLLRRGDSMVSGWWSDQVIAESREGFDVEFVFPKEGAISAGEACIVVSANARNKNLALEWVKFLTSKRGYEIAYDIPLLGYLIPRRDLPVPAAEEQFQPPENVPVFSDNEFRLFIESEPVLADFLDLYTKIVIQGH